MEEKNVLSQIAGDLMYAHNQCRKFSDLLNDSLGNGNFKGYLSKLNYYGELEANLRSAMIYSVMRDNGYDLNHNGEYFKI